MGREETFSFSGFSAMSGEAIEIAGVLVTTGVTCEESLLFNGLLTGFSSSFGAERAVKVSLGPRTLSGSSVLLLTCSCSNSCLNKVCCGDAIKAMGF